jgi:hypothetical protein
MKKALIFFVILGCVLPTQPVYAGNTDTLSFMEEKVGGYDRSLFKHWIDDDKDGCDTRKEVLIEEAIVKPKIGKKCVLSGGIWLSSYDNKTIKGSGSTLDVDHMVPLAEAWRSGAWQWTNAERQLFANDMMDSRVLIAVTASSNRSKSDRDLANWLPKASKEVVCDYVFAWVAVKMRYYLSVDPKESAVIDRIVFDPECNARNASKTFKPLVAFEKYHVNYVSPTASASATPTVSATPTASATPTPTPKASATPTPTPTKIKPAPIKYKNCTEAKAAGVTPILRSTDPELYALNTALDGDKDGDACES